jgi:hypothetical protein
MICIFFPGGAGGNWLSNLIHKLETREYNNSTDENIVHFHKHKKSKNIILTHERDQFESAKHRFSFSDSCAFNFYLNGVVKFLLHDKSIDTLHHKKMLDILIDYASGSLDKIYLTTTDLYYTDMFLNPDKFVDTLFYLLEKNNLSVNKDKQIVIDSIKEFKITSIDPLLHFNNYSSIYWTGWCLGLIKFFNIPLSFNVLDLEIKELIEELKKFDDFFINETKKVMFTKKAYYE